MYENLRRYQEEKRSIKTDPVEFALKAQAAKQQKERDDKLDESFRNCKSMGEVVTAIEEVSGFYGNIPECFFFKFIFM